MFIMEDNDNCNIIDPLEEANAPVSSEELSEKVVSEPINKEFDQKLTISEDKIDSDPIIEDESKNGFGDSTAQNIASVGKDDEQSDGLVFSTGTDHEEEEIKTSKRAQPSANISSEVHSSTPSDSVLQKGKPKSKYFDNIDTMEMTRLMMELQEADPEEFKALMTVGNELIKDAENNDVAAYHTKLLSCKNTNFLFWHTSKAFKKGLDCFNKEIVEYILKSLEVDMSHEVFKFILHYFITRCIPFSGDAAQQRYAADIFELLVKYRKGKVSVDEMDPSHDNITALQMTCKYGLYELAKKLLELGT